jgi:hypothetical protein
MAVVCRKVAYTRGGRVQEYYRYWDSVAMQKGGSLCAEELEGGRWSLRKRRLALEICSSRRADTKPLSMTRHVRSHSYSDVVSINSLPDVFLSSTCPYQAHIKSVVVRCAEAEAEVRCRDDVFS